MQPQYLFVYGTLCSEFHSTQSSVAQRVLQESCQFIGPGHWTGKLFQISWYPAAVRASSGTVYGEIYKILNPKALPLLDQYEECASRDRERHEYERTLENITLLNTHNQPTSELTAWMYVYRLSTEGLREIPSGNFITHSQHSQPEIL